MSYWSNHSESLVSEHQDSRKGLKGKRERTWLKIFHLYGVMEDIEGPDTVGDDVRGLGEAH